MKDCAAGLGLLAAPMGFEAGGAAAVGGGGAVGAGGAAAPPPELWPTKPPTKPLKTAEMGSTEQRWGSWSWGFMRPFFLGSRGCIRSRRRDGGGGRHRHLGYEPMVLQK